MSTPDLFRPPMDHLIHRPKPYVPANQTDIRKTFARVTTEAAQDANEQKVLTDSIFLSADSNPFRDSTGHRLHVVPLPDLTMPEDA